MIRGVSSNIAFQSALLVHPDFVSGDFHTGFIGKHFADGFRADRVPHEDPDFLLALAAASARRYLERAAGISGQLPGHGVRIGEKFTLVLKGDEGAHRFLPVTIVRDEAISVTLGGKTYAVESDWHFGGIRATGLCNGKPFTAQVERHGLWTRIQHNGLTVEVMVMRARAAELMRWMPFKPPMDMSKFLLSPMPGLLVKVLVEVGQEVQVGERLAVVEAMKMENILVASHDGVVKEMLAAQGESLAVDQPILAFE